jgi:hypothetical protein
MCKNESTVISSLILSPRGQRIIIDAIDAHFCSSAKVYTK